jgi:hypothetical protein
MFYLAVASLLLMSDVTDATSLIDSPRESSKKAWVTVLTDSNFNNTQLAATQILSVKRFSEHEHITLVLSLVDEETREFLEGLGSSIVEVSRIQPPFKIAGEWFQDIFSRLHLWNLLDFEQVAYLDADALLINDDADGIFNECDADFCAVGRDRLSFDEQISDESRNMGDTQLFNAGVMVLRPDKDVFDYLVNEALPGNKISDAEYSASADEHFLAEIFFQLKHNLRTFQHRSHVGSSKLLGKNLVSVCNQDNDNDNALTHTCLQQKSTNFPLLLFLTKRFSQTLNLSFLSKVSNIIPAALSLTTCVVDAIHTLKAIFLVPFKLSAGRRLWMKYPFSITADPRSFCMSPCVCGKRKKSLNTAKCSTSRSSKNFSFKPTLVLLATKV